MAAERRRLAGAAGPRPQDRCRLHADKGAWQRPACRAPGAPIRSRAAGRDTGSVMAGGCPPAAVRAVRRHGMEAHIRQRVPPRTGDRPCPCRIPGLPENPDRRTRPDAPGGGTSRTAGKPRNRNTPRRRIPPACSCMPSCRSWPHRIQHKALPSVPRFRSFPFRADRQGSSPRSTPRWTGALPPITHALA